MRGATAAVRNRSLTAVAAIVIAAACGLFGASTASAILTWPQHVGDPCTANTVSTSQTAIALQNHLFNVPPYEIATNAPPETPSVITSWAVEGGAGMIPIQEKLVAFRASSETEYQVVGESSLETVAEGKNEFLTRVPVPEYAVVGLSGPNGALICANAERSVTGLIAGPWSSGESRPFKFEVDTGVPVIAKLEPDRDSDHYGDETQDQCLEQPLLHTPCPFVRLRPEAKAFRRGILVEVTTGDPTQVEVSGQVAWGYRPGGGGPARRLIAGLSADAQPVAAATVGFWLPLPSSVIGRLGKLTSKERLNAHLMVVATDVIGHVTTRKMGVRLPGYLKPHPSSAHHP